LGLAKAPSSPARSWRMGWTRMTCPSLDSCTEAATMATSMAVRAHLRPASVAWVAPHWCEPGPIGPFAAGA